MTPRTLADLRAAVGRVLATMTVRLAGLAAIALAQWASGRVGEAVDLDAYRAVRYEPCGWALLPPRRTDESGELLLDASDVDVARWECVAASVDRIGPLVVVADWCPDGRGQLIVLHAARETDADALQARVDAERAAMDARLDAMLGADGDGGRGGDGC